VSCEIVKCSGKGSESKLKRHWGRGRGSSRARGLRILSTIQRAEEVLRERGCDRESEFRGQP
jgi:hypothetical protein